MENQTKKVTSIQGAGTYEGKHGILYSFDYSFDDETTIRANHKTTAPPFSVGDEVDRAMGLVGGKLNALKTLRIILSRQA